MIRWTLRRHLGGDSRRPSCPVSVNGPEALVTGAAGEREHQTRAPAPAAGARRSPLSVAGRILTMRMVSMAGPPRCYAKSPAG